MTYNHYVDLRVHCDRDGLSWRSCPEIKIYPWLIDRRIVLDSLVITRMEYIVSRVLEHERFAPP